MRVSERQEGIFRHDHHRVGSFDLAHGFEHGSLQPFLQLAALRQAITTEYEVVARAAAAIDPTIEKPIRNLANQALTGTQDAEKRLVSHLKKRQATETQQIARARELVLPLGKPQERVHTLAPWLARYGPSLLAELADTIHQWMRRDLKPVSLPPRLGPCSSSGSSSSSRC